MARLAAGQASVSAVLTVSTPAVVELSATITGQSSVLSPGGLRGPFLTGPQQDTKLVRFDDDVSFRVDVAFDTPFLLQEPQWTSISTDVRGFQTQQSDGPSRLTVLLNNNHSKYDPRATNPWYDTAKSAYVNAAYGINRDSYDVGVQTMRQIRVQAVHAGTTYDLYRGFIDGWRVAYSDAGLGDVTATVTATDGLKVLSLLQATSTFAAETVDVRIGNLLTAAGWPTGWRNIQASSSTMAADSFEDQSVLAELRRVADQTASRFFMDRAGNAALRTVSTDNTAAAAGVQYRGSQAAKTFSHRAAVGVPYQRLQVEYDDADLYTEIRYTYQSATTGIDPVVVSSTAEGDRFGTRTLEVNDTTVTVNDGTFATRYANAHIGNPITRVGRTEITVRPRAASTAWDNVLGLDLDDRIVIERRLGKNASTGLSDIDVGGFAFARQDPAYLDALVHNVNVQGLTWDVTLSASGVSWP